MDSAKVTGAIFMTGANFDGKLIVGLLEAHGVGPHDERALDLQAVRRLDRKERGTRHPEPAPAHIGNLMGAQDAWPGQGQLRLDGSASIILADLREKLDRKCARGEWSGGIIGRGSIPNTVPLPTRNSPPH
jgi:hypothetical protein